MKPKLKENKEVKKRNFDKNENKNKDFSSLKNSKLNYVPEFATNKTVKDYVESKLDNKKNIIYSHKIKNKKDEKSKNSLFKKNKNKSCINKPLNSSDFKQKNGGNYEEMNKNDSIMHSTINFSNTGGFNDNLNRINFSHKDTNSNSNKNGININNKANEKIVSISKKHLINKVNDNTPKKIKINNIENNFNNDYYSYANNYNNHSSNNIFDGNGIYKKKNKFKSNKKDISLNDTIPLTPDKNKTYYNFNKKKPLKYSNCKNSKKNIILKTNVSQEKVNGKKINFNKKTLSAKKIENGLNIKVKKEENIINHIIRNIFKNAHKAERKLYNQKEHESRLYSPLLNIYKNGNVRINKNTSVIKCCYSNKEKIFIEYQNQIKK
jgi:hypothetical protein